MRAALWFPQVSVEDGENSIADSKESSLETPLVHLVTTHSQRPVVAIRGVLVTGRKLKVAV